jgi:hypothetical protein
MPGGACGGSTSVGGYDGATSVGPGSDDPSGIRITSRLTDAQSRRYDKRGLQVRA